MQISKNKSFLAITILAVFFAFTISLSNASENEDFDIDKFIDREFSENNEDNKINSTSSTKENQLPEEASKNTQNSNEVTTNEAMLLFKNLPVKASLMYSRPDLDILYQVLSNITPEERLSAEDSAGHINAENLLDIDEESKSIENVEKPDAPNLYLNSILYLSPESWTIWLNGQKIRKGNESILENIRISKISNNSIELMWHTPYLDKISPNWENNFPPTTISSSNILTQNANETKIQRISRIKRAFESGNLTWTHNSEDKKIYIDKPNGTIKLTLNPHQSFVSTDMTIIEGKKSHTNLNISNNSSETTLSESPTEAQDDNFDELVDDLFNQ